MGYDVTVKPMAPGIDGSACPLMWHTSFQLVDYNRNPTALKVLQEWADTWLKYQKPGQWATAIEVETGKVVSFHKERPLSGGYPSQAASFLWLYALTGKTKYIEPFMYCLRKAILPYPLNTMMSDVCALGMLDALDPKTRDRLLRHGGIMALDVKGDPGPFIQQVIGRPRNRHAAIDSLYDVIRYPDMYTKANQYTDRVFLGDLQARASEAFLGAYCKRNKYNPVHAVSWEGFGTMYAALVLKNRVNKLKVAVYSFADKPMKGVMRLWRLEHGRYRISLGIDRNGDFQADSPTLKLEKEITRADGIDVELAPKAITIIEMQQLERLEPIFNRADIAISAREIQVQGKLLTGTVHNIGSKRTGEIIAAVVDAKGRRVAEESLGTLDAPIDLVPKKRSFRIVLPAAPGKGWKLLLDPDNKVMEIYEGNNQVLLHMVPAKDNSKGWD